MDDLYTMVSTRSMERNKRNESPSDTRPENWRPEDDKPELHHIPHSFGVPIEDFNWDWYFAQQQKRTLQMEIQKNNEFPFIQYGVILLVVLLVIYAMIQ